MNLRLFFIGFVLVVAMSCAGNQADNYPLPNLENITSIKAYYYPKGLSKPVEFLVPHELWEGIFSALLPATRDDKPALWVYIVSVR